MNIITSEWFQVLFSLLGWLIAGLLTTKIGLKVLSFFRHIYYVIKNPPIIYSVNYNFTFPNIETDLIVEIMKNIYNHSLLSKYKLNRAGIKGNCCKLHYPGIDYLIETTNIDDNVILNIKINETESNYNNLNMHIKKIIIQSFGREIILNEILKKLNTSQFNAIYQLTLKFSETQNNYFIKERFTRMPKGYVSSCLLTVKDKSDTSFILSANLKELTITLENNFDNFIDMISKYSSII